MASYTFVESSGRLDNAIMIVKENNVVVDTDIVLMVNLYPAGQTAQNCKHVYILPRCVAHAESLLQQQRTSPLELQYLLHSLHLTTHSQYHWRLLMIV